MPQLNPGLLLFLVVFDKAFGAMTESRGDLFSRCPYLIDGLVVAHVVQSSNNSSGVMISGVGSLSRSLILLMCFFLLAFAR